MTQVVATALAPPPPKTAPVPVDLVGVEFEGATLQAVRQGDAVFVSVRTVCEALGINNANQQTKLKKAEWATVVLITTVAEDGCNRETFCIDAKCLPMWLAGIQPGRVSESVRPKLLKFQLEAASALAAHFFGAPTVTPALPAAQPAALTTLDAAIQQHALTQ